MRMLLPLPLPSGLSAAPQSYLSKYDCLSRLNPGGVCVLNATWKSAREMEAALPAKVLRQLAALGPQLYVVDARAVADAVGLGKRINMVMQTGEGLWYSVDCMAKGAVDIWLHGLMLRVLHQESTA